MNPELLHKSKVLNPEYEKDTGVILNSIFEILNENALLTLSTVEGDQPHSISAFFVFDDSLNLYIWTDRDASHTRHFKINPKVSVNIADTSQEWGSLLKGLQMRCVVEPVSGTELMKAGALYMKRFPNVSKYVKKASDFVSGELESILFRLKLEKVKVLDEKKFGKEGFRVILVRK